MILLSSIVKAFEAAFLAQYSDSILPSHRKALAATVRLALAYVEPGGRKR